MALERLDACRKFLDGGDYQKTLVYYAGDYSGKTSSWEVTCDASEVLDAAIPTAPTDAEVHVVADAKATTVFNAWTAAIDAETVTEELLTGQAGTVLA